MKTFEILRSLFYLSASSLYILAVYTDMIIYMSDSIFLKTGFDYHRTFGGRLKFLTYIDMNIQAVYFTACALNIGIKLVTKKKNKSLERFCNGLATSLVFPIGTIVTFLFWGVYAVDRSLIYQKGIESAIPDFQNHLVHTLPFISAVIDHMITKHTYSKSFFKGVSGTVIFFSAYLAWVFIIAHFGGFWVYKVLAVLSTFYRGVFILSCLILAIFLYKMGESLNKFWWPTKPVKSS